MSDKFTISRAAFKRYLDKIGYYECICGNVWEKGRPCLYVACPTELEKSQVNKMVQP